MSKMEKDGSELLEAVEMHPAVELFHGAEGYNCAQAVVKYFEKPFCVDPAVITALKGKGGGRADKGFCGALYGALYLYKDHSAIQDMIINHFQDEAGFITCREIKRNRTLSCQECVNLASHLVEKGKQMEK